MSYPTLLLHMGIQQANDARLIVARELADRFDALMIGAAACNPQPPASFEGLYPVDVIQVDRTYAKEQLDAAEAEFRQGFAGRENRIEWRSAFEPPITYLTRLCRAADVAIELPPVSLDIALSERRSRWTSRGSPR